MNAWPPAWLSVPVLPVNGVELRVRPLEAADAMRERRFIARLSPEALRQRVLGSVREPSDQQIAELVKADWPRRIALALLREEEIVAVARLEATAEPAIAEFAIVVADEWQRKGLGHRLLAMLVLAAQAAGYRELVGTTFADNRSMIELARSHGFLVDPEPGESSLRRLHLALAHER